MAYADAKNSEIRYGRKKFIGIKPENNEMARAKSPFLVVGRCSAIRLRRKRVAAFFSASKLFSYNLFLSLSSWRVHLLLTLTPANDLPHAESSEISSEEVQVC
ncbi:unnamed protein product [Ilex paraguariensis]|uniref:Uncharacterized protein n=1 Tax=Ilex paraguariensis TaxID=185542 RepID=A0ABC8TT26_9AQUA